MNRGCWAERHAGQRACFAGGGSAGLKRIVFLTEGGWVGTLPPSDSLTYVVLLHCQRPRRGVRVVARGLARKDDGQRVEVNVERLFAMSHRDSRVDSSLQPPSWASVCWSGSALRVRRGPRASPRTTTLLYSLTRCGSGGAALVVRTCAASETACASSFSSDHSAMPMSTRLCPSAASRATTRCEERRGACVRGVNSR